MYFNMFLLQFGLNPEDFEDISPNPIETEDGFIYEIRQKLKSRFCKECGCESLIIHDRKWITLKGQISSLQNIEIRILRIRVKCKECGAIYTVPIQGQNPYDKVINLVKNNIAADCKKIESFSSIAYRYGLSVTTIINVFDDKFPFVKRKKMPEKICVDELHLEHDGAKYITVLSNYDTGEIIDIIKDRKDAYLDDYFRRIPEGERRNTKVFICDMYKGFSRVHDLYFPKSTLCIDLFHMLKQLRDAVSTLRRRTMHLVISTNPDEARFMKDYWGLFETNEHHIGNGMFYKVTGEIVPQRYMIIDCLKLDQDLWDGYRILQELLQYNNYDDYMSASKFINRIKDKLLSSQNELLYKVGLTYKRWEAPVSEGLIKRENGKRYTNALAEGNNSHIRRVINVSYGYKNFDRFRNRVLLIRDMSLSKKKA